MKKQEFLKTSFSELCKKEGIKIRKWNHRSTGCANIEKRVIDTPRPTSVYRFMVGLHECSHVIYNLNYAKYSILTCEYKTEIKTIALAKKYNLHKLYPREFNNYVAGAKYHVFGYCKAANSYPKSIMNWIKQYPPIYKFK